MNPDLSIRRLTANEWELYRALRLRALPDSPDTFAPMTESVLAPVWVWAVLGEEATVATLLGGALVLGAVSLQATQGASKTPRGEPAVAEP